MTRYAVPLLALAAIACGEGFDPSDFGAVRFEPPPSYRLEWARAQACSGRAGGDFDRLSWWVVPGVQTIDYDPNEPRASGIYHTADHSITLAGAALESGRVVRHELLHALGFGADHPTVPFADPCRATWASRDTLEAPLEIPPELQAYLP
jgi:hypothetical protein